MFCFSLKSAKKRLFMLTVGIVAALLCVIIVSECRSDNIVSVSAHSSASSHEQRIAFLYQFGWNVEEDPISVDEIYIPSQFGDVYTQYNEIQLAQGYDLLPYAGRCVKKWVYAVTNYPGYSKSEAYVRATILVCGNRIIGGDICSVELDGFMHGFAYESKD